MATIKYKYALGKRGWTEVLRMRFKVAFARNEVFITPAFGIINECGYYGYPVIAICFAWLRWRCNVEIGAKRGGGNRK